MQFIFEHSTHALLPFLTETGQYIKTSLPAGTDDMLLHKCKFILTELCTNGIKHSGQPESIFDIIVDNNHLAIHRKDKGLPFHAGVGKKEALLLPDEITSTLILTEDDINRLTMQRIDDYCVRFYVEEISADCQTVNQTMGEHFGLIIICRSSDNFTYTRLPSGENIFSVSIGLM